MPLLNWHAMVYGSGHPSMGGSGVAPDGSKPEEWLEKRLTELLIARTDYVTGLRKEGFRYEVARLQAEVDTATAWQDLVAALEETRGRDARSVLENATRAHGDMLQAKRDWDEANDLRTGQAVQAVLGYRQQVPGASAEEALAHALTDPSVKALVEGDPALPGVLDRLKRELYTGSYDPETRTYRSFSELGALKTGGHAELLSNLMRLEADAEATRRRVAVAGTSMDDLGSSLTGLRGEVEAGRSVDMTAIADKARKAVVDSSAALGGKTRKQAEQELAEVSKSDEALKTLDDQIKRLQSKIGQQDAEGDSIREQVGIMMSGPKLRRWAEQKHLHIGTSEVRETRHPDGTVTRTLVPGSYQAGRDDEKAVMLWLREQQHPPEHRWQPKDTGLLVRVRMKETTPALQDHYRMPDLADLPGVKGRYARVAETRADGSTAYTYLDADQVSAVLEAHGTPGIVGKGRPEVYYGETKDGRAMMKVERRGRPVYYAVADDDVLRLEMETPDVASWQPLAKGNQYMSSAGLRDGRKVPSDATVMDSDMDRWIVAGNPKEVAQVLDSRGIELTDDPPSRGAEVYGALVPNDPRDKDGVVRVSTGGGLVVLGTDPGAPVERVEIVGEKARGGILSIQSMVRGRRAQQLAEQAGQAAPGGPVKRDLIGGVEVYDVRAAGGAKEARPPGPLGKIADAIAGKLAPVAPSERERAEERLIAARGRQEAAERARAAEGEPMVEGATAAEREGKAAWEKMNLEERFHALRAGKGKITPQEAEKRKADWDRMIRDAAGMPPGEDRAAVWDRLIRESAGADLTADQHAAIDAEAAKRGPVQPPQATPAPDASTAAPWQVRPSFEAAAGPVPPGVRPPKSVQPEAEPAPKPAPAPSQAPPAAMASKQAIPETPGAGPALEAGKRRAAEFLKKLELPLVFGKKKPEEPTVVPTGPSQETAPRQFREVERAGKIVREEVAPPTTAAGSEVTPTSQERKANMEELKRRVTEAAQGRRLLREMKAIGGQPEDTEPAGAP